METPANILLPFGKKKEKVTETHRPDLVFNQTNTLSNTEASGRRPQNGVSSVASPQRHLQPWKQEVTQLVLRLLLVSTVVEFSLCCTAG